MFVVTQFIGLYIVQQYSPRQEMINGSLQNVTPLLPFGMQPPGEIQPVDALTSIVIAFVIAIVLVFILTKFKAEVFLKLWFFIVIVIALAITFNVFIPGLTQEIFSGLTYSEFLALLIALPFAYFKVFKRNMLVHNFTELLIYPGIAAIFVPILNLWSIIVLLVLISVYDMYAVWHAGFMQKMAKYQIEHLKIFAGFFVPYMDKKTKMQVQKMTPKQIKMKKVKVNVAILGGGDVVFPIITAGVMLNFFGLVPALLVILGATLGLAYLFFFAEKGKFYPAMPFITAGIFTGMLVSWLIAFI
jgi:presenilin-like A22 family membrane protease